MTILLKFDLQNNRYTLTESIDKDDIKYYMNSPIHQFAESYRNIM